MKFFKIISTIFNTLLFLLLLLVAGSLVLTRVKTPINYKLYSVQSGSMEPKVPLGSLILVVPQENYDVGDVVTYRGERNLTQTVTHRIVNISRDTDLDTVSYRTKGDANENPDMELVPSDRVVGKVSAYLPYLGYPVGFVQTQTGFIALIIVPATIIIYSEIVSIGNEVKTMVKKRQEKKAAQKREQEEVIQPVKKTGKKFTNRNKGEKEDKK